MSDQAAPADVIVRSWNSRALDIVACDRTEFVVALLEHERPRGVMLEFWPPAAQARFRQAFNEWFGVHTARAIKAITFGIENGCCVAVLHHIARDAEAASR